MDWPSSLAKTNGVQYSHRTPGHTFALFRTECATGNLTLPKVQRLRITALVAGLLVDQAAEQVEAAPYPEDLPDRVHEEVMAAFRVLGSASTIQPYPQNLPVVTILLRGVLARYVREQVLQEAGVADPRAVRPFAVPFWPIAAQVPELHLHGLLPGPF